MPQHGDRHPGFIVEPMKCWAMVYDGTMQADHCPERPNWTGRGGSAPEAIVGGGCGPALTTWTG
jgi:hypothetical protein